MRVWAMFLLFAVTVPQSVPAQAPRRPKTQPPLPPSAFKLVSVQVKGTQRYKPDDVVAATGLEIGHAVSEDDFKAVSKRLGETGAFSEVTYSYQYSPDGTKLIVEVAETPQTKFVPVRFENIVWFSDRSLLKELHTRVPLFNGELPISGNLPDHVSEELQALLVEHQISATADYLRVSHPDGPTEGFTFSVSGPSIRIQKVDFTGAGAEEAPLLQAAGEKLKRKEYLRSTLESQWEKDFLPVYLGRGHLKAALSDIETKVAEDSTPQEINVDVTFTVTPGPQYKTQSVEWAGNQVLSTETLVPLLHLKSGQPANAVELDKDLDAVRSVYGTRGYVAASIHAVPQMDDSGPAVKYRIEVHEGDVYYMGELDIEGLDSRSKAKLEEKWKIPASQTYDASYPKRFFDETEPGVPNGPWNITIHETPNEKDKTVDVTLRYDPKP